MKQATIRTDRQFAELGRMVVDMLRMPNAMCLFSEPRMVELGDGNADRGGKILSRLTTAMAEVPYEKPP